MCFNRLVLVDPRCSVGEVAYARASGANSVLDERRTFGSLAQAIADCDCVIATSARRRSLAWPELSPGTMSEKLVQMGESSRVALVFGREHSGLTNEELQLCNYMLSIPANPEFSSLNLASAIQIVCYEIYRRQAIRPEAVVPDAQDLPATSAETEGYFAQLQQVLESSGFLNPEQPGLIMQRLRRLYLRSEPTRNEVNILRGILSAIEKRRD
jgi:tRNA (cytidine32/uridine32-2'-O)-methyltransferase